MRVVYFYDTEDAPIIQPLDKDQRKRKFEEDVINFKD